MISYHALQAKLLCSLAEETDHRQLMEDAARWTGLEILILDPSLTVMAGAAPNGGSWSEILSQGTVPLDSTWAALRGEAFQALARGSTLLSRRPEGLVAMAALRKDNRPAGLLALRDTERQNPTTLERIANLLTRILIHGDLLWEGGRPETADPGRAALTRALLLREDERPEALLQDPMAAPLFPQGSHSLRGAYAIAAIVGEAGAREQLRKLAADRPWLFLTEGETLWVFLTELEPESQPTLGLAERQALTALGLRAGLSNCFSDLGMRRHYRMQAYHTLQVGSRQVPGQALYASEDYYLQQLLSSVADAYGREVFLCREAVTLLEHDQIHHTALAETLYAYLLHGCSLLKASRVLFLDRGTVGYRLRKIRELLQVDLDDPELARQLLLSLTLQRMA